MPAVDGAASALARLRLGVHVAVSIGQSGERCRGVVGLRRAFD